MPLGSQRSIMGDTAALRGWHYRPSQNRKGEEIFYWRFGLGKRMLFQENEHLVAQLTNYSRVPRNSTTFPKLNM